jgi:hypothetical protein
MRSLYRQNFFLDNVLLIIFQLAKKILLSCLCVTVVPPGSSSFPAKASSDTTVFKIRLSRPNMVRIYINGIVFVFR